MCDLERVLRVWWLFLQHVCDIRWCNTAVTVESQTDYFVCASYFVIEPKNDFKCMDMLDDYESRMITRVA